MSDTHLPLIVAASRRPSYQLVPFALRLPPALKAAAKAVAAVHWLEYDHADGVQTFDASSINRVLVSLLELGLARWLELLNATIEAKQIELDRFGMMMAILLAHPEKTIINPEDLAPGSTARQWVVDYAASNMDSFADGETTVRPEGAERAVVAEELAMVQRRVSTLTEARAEIEHILATAVAEDEKRRVEKDAARVKQEAEEKAELEHLEAAGGNNLTDREAERLDLLQYRVGTKGKRHLTDYRKARKEELGAYKVRPTANLSEIERQRVIDLEGQLARLEERDGLLTE